MNCSICGRQMGLVPCDQTVHNRQNELKPAGQVPLVTVRPTLVDKTADECWKNDL